MHVPVCTGWRQSRGGGRVPGPGAEQISKLGLAGCEEQRGRSQDAS